MLAHMPPLESFDFAGRNAGIPWADRFTYCQPGASLPPGVQLEGSYWQGDCVMPLGRMYWVLAVQVGCC